MGAFLSQNIISIIFGLTTLVTSMIAIHYRRLEHRRDVEQIVYGRRVTLFLSREAMIQYLLEMYDKAEKGDEIWAQCVRCTNFSPDVRNKILKAAQGCSVLKNSLIIENIIQVHAIVKKRRTDIFDIVFS